MFKLRVVFSIVILVFVAFQFAPMSSLAQDSPGVTPIRPTPTGVLWMPPWETPTPEVSPLDTPVPPAPTEQIAPPTTNTPRPTPGPGPFSISSASAAPSIIAKSMQLACLMAVRAWHLSMSICVP